MRKLHITKQNYWPKKKIITMVTFVRWWPWISSGCRAELLQDRHHPLSSSSGGENNNNNNRSFQTLIVGRPTFSVWNVGVEYLWDTVIGLSCRCVRETPACGAAWWSYQGFEPSAPTRWNHLSPSCVFFPTSSWFYSVLCLVPRRLLNCDVVSWMNSSPSPATSAWFDEYFTGH